MDYNKKSLIDKIVAKNVLSPYEAIYIQHLNNQHVGKQANLIINSTNFYEAAEHIPPLISEYQRDQIVRFNTQQDGQLYDAYRWAVILLSHLDSTIGDTAYQGIALLNEIRYARYKNILEMVLDKNKQEDHDVLKFSIYSHVFQKNMTFSEIVASFGTIFKFLIIGIDDILTLNYFLNGMYSVEDLHCLNFLKMLLAVDKPNQEEEATTKFDLPQVCMDAILNIVIENNHPMYVSFVKSKISSFGVSTRENFQEGSLQYFKETFANVVNQAKQ